jgi:RNA polymerase sigma factor (sigma-70 family)
MRTGAWRTVLNHLRLADGGGLTDGQLLARFIDNRDEAAFAALVRRHGPMVLGVCRRVLGHAHDAEDAFQATFLLLARKATSVVRREAVGSFLYGVAYRTALRARAQAARRRAIERQVEDMPHPEVPPPEAQDWRPVLDRELSQLPEKYRAAVVLCDLECKTRREAARQLGVLEGTLASRLATARRMLAKRLARSGLSLSGGALAMALAADASAAVPAAWVLSTVRAATVLAAGSAAGAATPAVALMNEVLQAMLMTKLKVVAATVLVAVLFGAGGLVYRAAGQGTTPQKPVADRPLTELEILRREVEILKLQVEVMREKVRAQEADLRALKGQMRSGQGTSLRLPGMPSGSGPQMPSPPGAPTGSTRPPSEVPGAGPGGLPPGFPTTPGGPAAPALPGLPGRIAETPPASPPPGVSTAPGQPVSPSRSWKAGASPPPGASTRPLAPPGWSDSAEEVEAALKAFQEAPDSEAKQRAADRLEKALRKWRQHVKPQTKAPPGPEE